MLCDLLGYVNMSENDGDTGIPKFMTLSDYFGGKAMRNYGI